MDPIRTAITKPVAVAVGVILVVMFGLIGLGEIPIQLTPTIDRPILNVSTVWPGRSPQEMADEIVKEQEERLKNVTNLKSMRATCSDGSSQITLEFYVGSDMAEAKQDVSDALRQVPSYPEDVDEPVITESEGAAENAIAWIIIDLPPEMRERFPDYDITTLFLGMDREVKPYLERIDGVAQVNVFGGREREARVLVDPVALAQRGLSYQEVISALRNENRDISGGTIAEGKRDYRVRVVGQFESAEDILDVIVSYRSDPLTPNGAPVPVYVRDIADVEIGYEKQRGFVRTLGQPVLAMNILRQSGSNVKTVMEGVQRELNVVRSDILPRIDPEVGPYLRMRQVYDETTYIDSAISLVLTNLWRGGGLAILALLVFLRSMRSTLVVAMAIPISLIGTFLTMLIAGRTLNVVSLAGLAFATGMVVDNAVVVLENIDRRRALGDEPFRAVYRGAKEVWGAVLAATLTTVAVFVPILTIQEEAGQLFFDLTLALAASVSLSLIVAITVVPSAANLLFGNRPVNDGKRHPIKNLFGIVPLASKLVSAFGSFIYWLMTGWRAWTLRPATIIGLTVASILGAMYLAPPLDYLPKGNRNLVFGGLSVPPGISVQERNQYAQRMEAIVRPYLDVDGSDPNELAKLPPIRRPWGGGEPYDPVGVENFFIGAFGGGMFVGGTSQTPEVVIPIGDLLTGAMNSIPAGIGGAGQSGIFGRGVGGGNTIDVEILGPDLDRVNAAAEVVYNRALRQYGFGKVSSNPSNFTLSLQEYQVRLTDSGRELGLTTSDVGTAVRALFDGAFAGDYILDGRKIDLVVLPKGGRLEYKEKLASIPVMTPAGKRVPIDSLVEIELVNAPQDIQRIEELPAVSIQITPPDNAALQEVMQDIERELIGPVRESGLISKNMLVRLEGTAAKLDEVQTALFGAAAPRAEPVSASGAPAGPAGQGIVSRVRVLDTAGIALVALSALLMGLGLLGGVIGVIRGIGSRARASQFLYGAVGSVMFGLILGGAFLAIALQPQLLSARFVWALLVTFLLMAALFESFLYPLVIMFSVPLAVVGGFGALRIVHDWTMQNPTIAPQQLDILTMIGFVILIGVVVNNAILIVQQSLNFMDPSRVAGAEHEEPLEPLKAIAQSVRTRCRPIFMTTCTTVGGGLPLVVAPGAGSEMYRGLGAVVVGGLFVSAFFTLFMVPLLFSLVLQMSDGFKAILARSAKRAASSKSEGDGGKPSPAPKPTPRPIKQPELEPAMARSAQTGPSPA